MQCETINLHVKSKKKFYKNFIFLFFFSKFCLILFDFIFQKKIEIYCSQLTVDFYCSKNTVHRLLFINYCSSITVDDLSCNTIIVLQYNPQYPSSLPHCNTLRCIAIQFNHSTSLLFTIHKGVLQYNFFPAHLYIAIPFSFSCNTEPTKPPKLQYNFPYCNTLANKPSLAIQFSTHQAISQYNLGNGLKPFLHFFSRMFFFSFKLLENHPKHKYTNFFFFPFLPATGRYTKKNIPIFFFIF